MVKVLTEVGKLFDIDLTQILFVDVHPCVNFAMKFGGFSSRAVHLPLYGRPLVAWGAQRAFNSIRSIVMETKQIIHQQLQQSLEVIQ